MATSMALFDANFLPWSKHTAAGFALTLFLEVPGEASIQNTAL